MNTEYLDELAEAQERGRRLTRRLATLEDHVTELMRGREAPMHTVLWASNNGKVYVEGRMQVQWHAFWGWMRFHNRRADREMLLARALRSFALQHGGIKDRALWD